MRYRVHSLLAGFILATTAAGPLMAIEADTRVDAIRPVHAFVLDALEVKPSLSQAARLDSTTAARTQTFLSRHGGSWEFRWDDRSDRPNVVQGSGIPLIPGRGNALTAQAGMPALDDVAAKVRGFIDGESDLLRAGGIELQLKRDSSVNVGGDYWSIEFQQMHQGVPVDGAFFYARIAQGNVVQFGAERIGEITASSKPALNREQTFARAWDELGFNSSISEWIEQGELRLYPVLPANDAVAEAYTGTRGAGYAHRLAWRYVFQLKDSDATWQVLVDAQTLRVMDLRNLTVNLTAAPMAPAKVSGGIFPTTNLDAEIVADLPFAAVTNGSAKVTDALGIYDYSGGAATTSLDGKYFKMADACGAIALSNSTDGNLNLGTSGGTDCTTPGIGGAGNTHASRTGFYHLTRINQKARTFLLNNNWLASKVTANMNVNQTCNASWGGSSANFYKSGAHPSNPAILCGNTGEIAAVFLHEWGHGMDGNSGGAANENGSGEAVGDTFAFLETRDSCIGPGFYRQAGGVCYNCTTCSGVRDLAEFNQTAPVAKLASPANVGSDTGLNCDRLACPYLANGIQPYQGPMGYEGHCESYIASTANWDLKRALVTAFGTNTGWATMDAIWYKSLTPSKSAYQVVSGGKCNTAAQVDGCGATNWYTVYLSADDDDGNLANGTPNACRIWDAFSAHGIACGARPNCTVAAQPDFTMGATASTQTVCPGGTANYSLQIGASSGFAAPVTLSLTGQPAGATPQFVPNPVTPGNNAALNITTTAAVATGSYNLTASGAATGSPGHTLGLTLVVGGSAAAAPTLSAPAAGATGVIATPQLSWQSVAGAASYKVEVATDAAFANIVASANDVAGTQWTSTALQGSTHYFWRVTAKSACGADQVSAASDFTTAAAPLSICRTALGAAIPDNNTTGVSDSKTVTNTGALTNLRLSIDITHTYVGDLNVILTKGSTSVTLMERPGNATNTGGSGCTGDNAKVVVDDAATLTLESNCGTGTPAYTIDGSYKPNNPLSAFNGTELSGDWTVRVVDAAAQDTGTLNGWCLIASVPSGPTDVIFANGFQ